MVDSKCRYVGFRFVGRSSESRLRVLAAIVALGLAPACDSAVDPMGGTESSSAGDSNGADGSTSHDTIDVTTDAPPPTSSPPPSTTSPPDPTTPTDTSPATTAVTSATSSGSSSGGDGSSESGVGPDTCGNGEVEFAEQCDGADLFGFTCEALGLGEGTLACSEDCLFDTSDCVGALPDCGDGIVQASEQCDQLDLQGFTCGALGLGGGVLSCNLNCTFDTSGCFDGLDCGDGEIGPGEQCDGNNLQGFTCESLGLGGGELACDEVQCFFDTTGCNP